MGAALGTFVRMVVLMVLPSSSFHYAEWCGDWSGSGMMSYSYLLDSDSNLPICDSCGGCIHCENFLSSSPICVPVGVTVVMGEITIFLLIIVVVSFLKIYFSKEGKDAGD